MFTTHFRAAAILRAKGKHDSKKQKKVENTGGGQQTCVCSEYGGILTRIREKYKITFMISCADVFHE